MRIVPLLSANVTTFAIKDNHDMLCGLITHIADESRWRIELLRQFVHHESTKEQAFAWVRGVAAVVERLESEKVVALATARKRG